jgi:hypothetical protein
MRQGWVSIESSLLVIDLALLQDKEKSKKTLSLFITLLLVLLYDTHSKLVSLMSYFNLLTYYKIQIIIFISLNTHIILLFQTCFPLYLIWLSCFVSKCYLIKVKIEKVMPKCFKWKTEKKNKWNTNTHFTRMFGPTSNTNFLLSWMFKVKLDTCQKKSN